MAVGGPVTVGDLGQVMNIVSQQDVDLRWQALEEHVLKHQHVLLAGGAQVQEAGKELGRGTCCTGPAWLKACPPSEEE